ncbi:kinase-like domain-containing protein [Xylogone sp. PMI_703]|nr:kinase-like domain-containing protein [Xylogone sp. PMI_703]
MASIDEITSSVLESLKGTPYECSSLTKLTGGTANFVYRGTLTKPLGDGSKTVAIKHTEGYVADSPDFKLTVERCKFEQTILSSLQKLDPASRSNITVTTPKLYYFSPTTNTQVYSDLPSSTTLKLFCLAHPTLSRQQCSRIGETLGVWARNFHAWGARPDQDSLRAEMRKSTVMKELKYSINYATLIARVSDFPEILQGSKPIFEEIAADVKRRMDAGEGTLIHGDFWTGNILLLDAPIPSEDTPLEIYVIDWELSHVSSLAFDLGQMFAEIYELKHFKDIDAGVWLIESFMEGYGKIDDDLAFKTAIHVGTHLICFGSRVAGWGSKEQVEAVVETGRDFIVRARNKDKYWFSNTALRSLFN